MVPGVDRSGGCRRQRPAQRAVAGSRGGLADPGDLVTAQERAHGAEVGSGQQQHRGCRGGEPQRPVSQRRPAPDGDRDQRQSHVGERGGSGPVREQRGRGEQRAARRAARIRERIRGSGQRGHTERDSHRIGGATPAPEVEGRARREDGDDAGDHSARAPSRPAREGRGECDHHQRVREGVSRQPGFTPTESGGLRDQGRQRRLAHRIAVEGIDRPEGPEAARVPAGVRQYTGDSGVHRAVHARCDED